MGRDQSATAEPAVIGKGITISGDLVGDGDIVVEGTVDGRVELTSDLRVAHGATVRADIRARTVTVAGSVTGKITASEAIALVATAEVAGDLSAPSIAIEEGAQLTGGVDMPLDLPDDLAGKRP